MKYPWLFVGAKVVCVIPYSRFTHFGQISWSDRIRWLLNPIKRGNTYTVTEVGYVDGAGDILMIRLAEVHAIYSANAFRPLIDTTSQVSAMRELMQKARDAMKDPTRIDEVMTVLIP